MADNYGNALEAMSERMYRMGGELIPESQMKEWHNSRGLPWGTPYEGPDPITIRRMVMCQNQDLSVHLANEHDTASCPRGTQVEHMTAHMTARFRKGQEHYHQLGGWKEEPDIPRFGADENDMD